MINRFIRALAKWYTSQCSICNTSIIETIIISNKEEKPCKQCKNQIVLGRILLKTILIFMKIKIDDLSSLSSDKETMPLINSIFRGIGKYGIKAIKIGIPLYVVFDITTKCNLKCIHCYSSTYNEELTTNEVYRILDNLYEAGAGIVDFGGGEPLLRDDIFDILSYSKRIGIYTSISTNGLLIDDFCIKRLNELKIDHICISLDGAKIETHDYIRNKKGTYEKIINCIRKCVNAGINTQVSTVFMNSNIDELEDIFNLLNKLHINGWYVYDFIPAGRGSEIKDEVLNAKERQKLFERLQGFAASSNISIKPYPYSITVNSASGKDTFFYKKYGQFTEFFKGCLTARWACHVSSNGDLHPCYLIQLKIGNLKQQSFHDIWFDKNITILKELRDRTYLKGVCGICKYKDVCGGCRARAFYSTGDYLESDSCWIKNYDIS